MSRFLTVAEIRELVSTLNPVQREVFYALLTGKTDKDIAHDVHRSWRTVKNYMGDIRTLFGVNTRLELVVLVKDAQIADAKGLQ